MLVDLRKLASSLGAALLSQVSGPYSTGVETPGNETTGQMGIRSVYQWTNSGGGPRNFTLLSADIARASVENPWIFTVIDKVGTASTDTCTIVTEGSELINGAASAIINTDFGGFTLMCDGSNLFIIASV